MTFLDAIILGIVQGLTEFLPVSSSGHLEILSMIMGVDGEADLTFATAVHAGTVLSTLVVFRKTIMDVIRGVFKFTMNPEMKFFLYIVVSMIPVFVVGMFFKEQIESMFVDNLILVGSMLIVTSILLTISHFVKTKEKEMSAGRAFVIGIAQACAVLPGLSRSGSTISTGLMLGIKREKVAAFSFLMAVIPILGASFLEVVGGDFSSPTALGMDIVLVGFISAFVAGMLACKVMVRLVSKGHLLWFALYCLLVGLSSVIYEVII